MTRAPRLPHYVLGVAAAIVTVVALLMPAHAAESNGLAITAVDVSKAPEVVLTVAVDGSVTTDELDADAFMLLVSGDERDAKLTGLPTDPMQIELVIDTSGSMRGEPLEAAKAAAQSLVDRLPPAAQVGILAFGNVPYEVSPATTDRAVTSAAISSLQSDGETALYDAVSAVTSRLTLERRAVVLLSDGRDTASTSTLEQGVAALAGARASFYAVVLQTPESDFAAADVLAAAAGGRVVQAADPQALTGVYNSIAGQLASTYQLAFRATATGSTGMVVRLTTADQTVEAEARATIPVADAAGVSSEPTPPPPGRAEVAPEPGPLQRNWVKWAGLAALFLAIATAVLVVMSRTPRPSQLAQRVKHAREAGAFQNLAEQATSFAERSLDRSGRRSRLEAALERAGINMRAGEFLVLVGVAAFATFAIFLLFTHVIVALLCAAAVVFMTRGVVSMRADRRRRQFGDQLEHTLPLLASGLRAGFGLMQALDNVARESEAPTSEEFRRLVVESRLGRDLSEALAAMAERVGNDDFTWVVQAIDIHRQIGGDLAEVLDSVQATIRDRNQLRRRIKALSGEGKLSAIILFVLPIAVLAWVALVNPDYLDELTGRGLGMGMIVGAAGLMVAGGLWMRKLVRIEF